MSRPGAKRRKVALAAGQLALAAQDILDAKPRAFERLRGALLEYDNAVISLHRRD